ncbi:MAG: hypothetical protein ACWA44_02475 [Thiotrichales bacterium]
MQDNTIAQLREYLEAYDLFDQVDYVRRSEEGLSAFRRRAYLRPDNLGSRYDYERDGEFLVGRYAFIADLTGNENRMRGLVNYLEAFSKAAIQFVGSSQNSEEIYINETSEELQLECSLFMIGFELRTFYDCTTC